MTETVEHLPKLIAERAKVLTAAGIQSAAAEIEWMLCHILDVDRLNLYLHGSRLLTPEKLVRLDELIQKRLTRWPLQFILNESWFYGRKFYVTPDVMAPTPETELLCEAALRLIAQRKLQVPRVLDVGTGSGVVAVTMANEAPTAEVVALDVSEAALAVARRNANALGADDRIRFRQSDLFEAVSPDERFDLILSNPPYIAEPDYAGLEPEVKADPKIAMTAGVEGLDIIKRLVAEAPGYLAPAGRIMFEIGYGQSEKIAALTSQDERYSSLDILQDLNGIDRIIVLTCGD